MRSARIEYRLAMPNPHTHLLEVEVRVPNVGRADAIELVMPSWTPGSYLLREFPRNVQDFEAWASAARSGEAGRAAPEKEAPVRWVKIDKGSWRITGVAEAGMVIARYKVYANELSVRTSHLDSSHASVNGASVFMYVRGREREELGLTVLPPEGWRVTTSLPLEEEGRFRAADYDELVDSPLEIGTHELLEWEQEGLPHGLAIWGRARYDAHRLVEETRRIVDAARALFGGGLPYERYLFILHILPEGRGGLEHRSSTLLQAGRGAFEGEAYENLLALVAHEFYHVWNAKRIRPEPLGPFDYTQENYTRSLWVVEGITTYYTDLILLRAGLIDRTRYLVRLGESIGRLRALPGRHHQTLEESSFDTWIRFYRPDENSPNSQISYYHKGALVALLLDLEIRRATAGERSLDDVMRALWERFLERDAGFPAEGPGGFEAVAEEVCGSSLRDFFDRYVRSTEELDFESGLQPFGLELAPVPGASVGGEALKGTLAAPTRIADAVAHETRLGARIKEEGGRMRATVVFAGTPAYEAGLNAGDELIALDGMRLAAAGLASLLRSAAEEDELELAVLRRGELVTLKVRLGAHPAPKLKIEPVAEPDASQEALLNGWLGPVVERVERVGSA